MNTVSVIVSKCSPTGDMIYGDRLHDTTHSALEEAIVLGEKKKEKGVSVVVRPNYNETDSQGRFFREWRSFNGEPLKECSWRF